MRFSLFLTLIFLLGSYFSYSQDSIRFEPLPKGISQGSVTKILKDQYGFMWFGTRYGLNKFDGLSYEHFPRKKDGNVFKDGSYVRDMELDEDGNLWIATEGSGVLKYDYLADTFLVYRNDPFNSNSLSANAVSTLLLDQENLWVGIKSRGINRIDLEKGTVDHFWSNIDDNRSISNNQTTAVEKDKQGNIWIGTWDGLSLYNPSSTGFIRYDLNDVEGIKTNKVVCMYNGKNLWLGLDKGVSRILYEDNRYRFEALQSESEALKKLKELAVLSMTEDSYGNLWIGTENGGLFFYHLDTEELSQYQIKDPNGAIISNSVWSLYVDDLGILWVGTFNGGVAKIDPHHRRMKHIYNKANLDSELSQNMVSSFAPINNDLVWVGTDGGGLNKFSLADGQVVQKFDLEKFGGSNAVLDVLLDRSGDLWLATWGGMMKKVGNSFTTYTYQPERLDLGPCGDQLFDLMEDQAGNIWIASFRGGISVYLKKEKVFKKLFQSRSEKNQILSERPTVIFQDSQQRIWVGTEGDGLYNVGVDENYNLIEALLYEYDENDDLSLSHNIINIIYEDENNNIWVGTEGGGLNRFDENESFTRFTSEDGLSSNLIYAIAQDNEGNLWLSTNDGLCQFNPITSDIRIFDETDGAQSSEFIKGAASTLPNGDLLFGGIKGFNHFTPASFTINTYTPSVYLTSLTFENNSDDPIHFGKIQQLSNSSKPLELAYEANDFVIDYAVLNYSKSSKNQFAYMLDGYDEQWIYPTSYRPARYTNVDPGKYTFKVKGSNNDGIWNQEIASLKIVINQPWWNTALAYSLYIILVCATLFGIILLIIKRERLRRNLAIEHLELEQMKELDTMKSRFFANISHEFRTPLTLIISPLKSMIDGFFKGDPKNQYKLMARNADRLLSLINQLLDLSKLEAGHMQLQASKQDIVKFIRPIAHSFTSYAEKQYIDYKCTFPEEEIPLFFEKDKVEKIVVNLLSNAFKFTQEFGKIDFSIVNDHEAVKLIVEDTGIGMSSDQLDMIFNRFYQIEGTEKKGTGIGLALTKELVELHKGNIQVASKVGHGTKFTVELKKGGDHLTDDEKTYLADDFHSKERESYVQKHPLDSFSSDSVDDSENENLPIVLIADDNEDIRLFISEHFASNYRILEASDGEKALKIALQEIPDIIISDVMMPKMDGYELCRELKLDAKTCHIPFILLTAKASNESALMGFELGADNYVTKPFNPKLLELRVRNILQSRENLKSQMLSSEEIHLEPSEVKVVSRDKEFLRKLIEFIEKNMSNSDLNIDDVCKEMGLSRTQLYRKLKGLVGQSANELIRSIRLKRAAQLIKSNEMTISEITYEVGFNDLQYFRFCFKKQFGVNPSEYSTQVEA